VIPCLDPLEALNWQRQRLYTQLGEVYLSDLGLEDDGMIVIAETFANGATNLRVPDLEDKEIILRKSKQDKEQDKDRGDLHSMEVFHTCRDCVGRI